MHKYGRYLKCSGLPLERWVSLSDARNVSGNLILHLLSHLAKYDISPVVNANNIMIVGFIVTGLTAIQPDHNVK